MAEVPEVKIEREIHKKLGMRASAETFFNNLDNDAIKIIIDFDNVEFMSRSFAQEYVYQKHQRKTEFIEKNMSDFVKKMLDIVNKNYADSISSL